MDHRLIISTFFLLSISSSFAPALSDRSLETLMSLHGLADAAGGGGGDANSMPCMQKLAPCQPYLHSPIPPPTCCVPLKEIVANDAACLCAVFNNPDMLKSLNLTKENAMDLPKACGANADISVCKNNNNGGATPPTAPPKTPSSPPASGNGTSSSGNSSKSAATKVIGLKGLSFVSAFMALMVVSLF